MTQPTPPPPRPSVKPMSEWSPGAWIAEAVNQYRAGVASMYEWHTTGDDLTYKMAANHTQAAIAAAAIASAKHAWNETYG